LCCWNWSKPGVPPEPASPPPSLPGPLLGVPASVPPSLGGTLPPPGEPPVVPPELVGPPDEELDELLVEPLEDGALDPPDDEPPELPDPPEPDPLAPEDDAPFSHGSVDVPPQLTMRPETASTLARTTSLVVTLRMANSRVVRNKCEGLMDAGSTRGSPR
jgi:hypothetical protein